MNAKEVLEIPGPGEGRESVTARGGLCRKAKRVVFAKDQEGGLCKKEGHAIEGGLCKMGCRDHKAGLCKMGCRDPEGGLGKMGGLCKEGGHGSVNRAQSNGRNVRLHCRGRKKQRFDCIDAIE